LLLLLELLPQMSDISRSRSNSEDFFGIAGKCVCSSLLFVWVQSDER
jgi:hypothetical protein